MFTAIALSVILADRFDLSSCDEGNAYGQIDRAITECEFKALTVGTTLADFYNNFDEGTEWDMRIHHDFLVEHLGFAGWIQSGLWKSGGRTPFNNHAPDLHKRGGWAGLDKISSSSYWALEDKWVYMMGDSTQRQVWATFSAVFQSNNFERNAKEWTRENCARQFPHRKEHPAGGYFPQEGWYGKCGNNEVTCTMSGFGAEGLVTFDWKHFPWEDYDAWLFGEEGKWKARSVEVGAAVERDSDNADAARTPEEEVEKEKEMDTHEGGGKDSTEEHQQQLEEEQQGEKVGDESQLLDGDAAPRIRKHLFIPKDPSMLGKASKHGHSHNHASSHHHGVSHHGSSHGRSDSTHSNKPKSKASSAASGTIRKRNNISGSEDGSEEGSEEEEEREGEELRESTRRRAQTPEEFNSAVGREVAATIAQVNRRLQTLQADPAQRNPDVLVIQVGLHTCFHAYQTQPMNYTMVDNHSRDLTTLMKAVRAAVDRAAVSVEVEVEVEVEEEGEETRRKKVLMKKQKILGDTMVIFQTAGRMGASEKTGDFCSWKFNRKLAVEAHKYGFAVLEREEIERRLLYRSEYHPGFRVIKQQLHIENPSPNIVGTALLALISCLERSRQEKESVFWYT